MDRRDNEIGSAAMAVCTLATLEIYCVNRPRLASVKPPVGRHVGRDYSRSGDIPVSPRPSPTPASSLDNLHRSSPLFIFLLLFFFPFPSPTRLLRRLFVCTPAHGHSSTMSSNTNQKPLPFGYQFVAGAVAGVSEVRMV